MPVLPTLLIASLVIIAFAEGILWAMFRQRVQPLNFPKELDRTGLRIFMFRRVRITALLHTLVMMALVTAAFLFLW